MKFIRLFTGKDKQSHFEAMQLEFFPAEHGELTRPTDVDSVTFGQVDVGETSWHNAPCRQYVIILQGAMEIEIGDGTKEIFHEGDVLLAEDLTGQGHITRTASSGILNYLAIPLK